MGTLGRVHAHPVIVPRRLWYGWQPAKTGKQAEGQRAQLRDHNSARQVYRKKSGKQPTANSSNQEIPWVSTLSAAPHLN